MSTTDEIMLIKSPATIQHSFSLAVAAAVAAYEASGSMCDAALAYAANGVPVFPVTVDKKKPVAARLKDEHGNPISGTGGFKRATTDPDQIRRWWKPNSTHLIGVPCGPRSGVWALDPDTKEDHDHDGVGAWKALQASHGVVTTREHRTATDGLHVIFAWDDARPVSSRGHLMPKGIDVKTLGGYFVTAPGKRKGRDYVVARDVDPIDAPAWLYDLLPGRPSKITTRLTGPKAQGQKGQQNQRSDFGRHIAAAFTEVARSVVIPRSQFPQFASALMSIANDDRDYDDWNAFIMSVFASTGGDWRGFRMARKWSMQSAKFEAKGQRFKDRWLGLRSSPPTDTGPQKIYTAAIEAGWEWSPPAKANTIAPSHLTLDDARAALRADFVRFVNYDKRERNAFEIVAEEMFGPRARAIGHKVETGFGKSTTMIDVLKNDTDKSALITVPQHNLGEELLAKMRAENIHADLFRGLMRPDPDQPGWLMCHVPNKVKAAIDSGQSVAATCCRSGKRICAFFGECGYQRQLEKTPYVWIAASNVLFHRQRAFRNVDLVIADEGFIDRALVGIDRDPIRISLDALQRDGDPQRKQLAFVLLRHPDGALRYSEIMQLSRSLAVMKKSEWDRFKVLAHELDLHPESPVFITKTRRRSEIARKMMLSRRIVNVLDDLEHMIDRKIAISGRMQIETNENGARFLKWRGLQKISKQYSTKPMLLMDATLPPKPLLKQLLPNVTIAKPYAVAPSAFVHRRRVFKAPASATKLIHGDAVEGHRQEIHRYILQRFMETGAQATLVIAQKPVADWLRRQKLPDTIAIEHYNNISGLDAYGRVGLQILIGRPAPGAQAIETLAATYSGAQPQALADEIDAGFSWYATAIEGVPLRNGKQKMVRVDRHPDELCEAVRWQITEAELLQADGRARPINRTADTPLTIDHLFDVPLPGIVIDENVKWEAPSRFIETAYSDGVMLLSPVDMIRLWPAIWASKSTADRDIADGAPTLPGFTEIRYRPKVPKAKRRTGWFDLIRVPEPALWLSARLGLPVEVTP